MALVSPEIHADRTVTFRLRAPGARQVKVSGELAIGTREMKREENGVWSVTVGPLKPELYGYGFVVDGLRITDPLNPRLKPQRSSSTSILDIPGNPPLLHDYQEVPHGTVHFHEYRSRALGVVRRLRVYTPPGYEQKKDTRYPVLYLLHGSGDNEATWTELGRAHLILDNLIAQGKARPMLIVMPDGHALPPGSENRGRAGEAFEKDLLNEVIPLVERTYRVQADAEHRAIAGLSMGARQALGVGLTQRDRFAWIGAMSGYVADPAKNLAAAINDPQLSKKVRLLWIAIGKDDVLLKPTEEMEKVLKEKQIPHTYRVTEGNHSWPVWRRYLGEFAPLLFQNR